METDPVNVFVKKKIIIKTCNKNITNKSHMNSSMCNFWKQHNIATVVQYQSCEKGLNTGIACPADITGISLVQL